MTPGKALGWFLCTGCSGKHKMGGGKGPLGDSSGHSRCLKLEGWVGGWTGERQGFSGWGENHV